MLYDNSFTVKKNYHDDISDNSAINLSAGVQGTTAGNYYHINTIEHSNYNSNWNYGLTLDEKYIQEVLNEIMTAQKDKLIDPLDVEIPPLRGFIEI